MPVSKYVQETPVYSKETGERIYFDTSETGKKLIAAANDPSSNVYKSGDTKKKQQIVEQYQSEIQQDNLKGYVQVDNQVFKTRQEAEQYIQTQAQKVETQKQEQYTRELVKQQSYPSLMQTPEYQQTVQNQYKSQSYTPTNLPTHNVSTTPDKFKTELKDYSYKGSYVNPLPKKFESTLTKANKPKIENVFIEQSKDIERNFESTFKDLSYSLGLKTTAVGIVAGKVAVQPVIHPVQTVKALVNPKSYIEAVDTMGKKFISSDVTLLGDIGGVYLGGIIIRKGFSVLPKPTYESFEVPNIKGSGVEVVGLTTKGGRSVIFGSKTAAGIKIGTPNIIELHLDLGGDLILDALLPNSTKTDVLKEIILTLSGEQAQPKIPSLSPAAVVYIEGLASERLFDILKADHPESLMKKVLKRVHLQ